MHLHLVLKCYIITLVPIELNYLENILVFNHFKMTCFRLICYIAGHNIKLHKPKGYVYIGNGECIYGSYQTLIYSENDNSPIIRSLKCEWIYITYENMILICTEKN